MVVVVVVVVMVLSAVPCTEHLLHEMFMALYL
jgi:hypothetical protein